MHVGSKRNDCSEFIPTYSLPPPALASPRQGRTWCYFTSKAVGPLGRSELPSYHKPTGIFTNLLRNNSKESLHWNANITACGEILKLQYVTFIKKKYLYVVLGVCWNCHHAVTVICGKIPVLSRKRQSENQEVKAALALSINLVYVLLTHSAVLSATLQLLHHNKA